ncbi:MAG: hypothetical protein IJS82_04390 [Paludibacteraceae bacterium]|nr:hypothetical protein [Paludibacteraceae bacterium]
MVALCSREEHDHHGTIFRERSTQSPPKPFQCNRLFLRRKPRRSTPTKDSERVARAREQAYDEAHS